MPNSNNLKYKTLIVLALLALVTFFFFRMYHNDVKAIADFSTSYEKFDKAISEYSVNQTDNLENRASDALTELNLNASFKLSSLIKNDNLIPSAALEVANFATEGLKELKAHNKDYIDFENKRKITYAHFEELVK
jgi:predicted negative regulator of RcsB-dependent stress response